MGCVLKLDNEIVWPGSARAIIFGSTFSDEQMDRLMQDNLVATGLIEKVSISKQYITLIEDLGTCGFRTTDNTLYLCVYDWRKDNKLAADILANITDKVMADHANQAEISLIGHSMGGLICRYYLESGDYDGRPGFAAVRRLLTLGTPHRGSPLALRAALGQEKRLWLSAEQVRRLVNDSRYPSLYQLMPPRNEPFAWNEDGAARFDFVDIYEESVRRTLGLNESNLQSAIDFQAKLDVARRPQHENKPIRYFFFSGTRQWTVSAVTMLKRQDGYRVRSELLEDAGDGTVPAWSSAVTGVQGQPVGGEHGTIYRNDVLRRTMGVLLGKAGVLAVMPEHVEVALRERVVNPRDPVHAALTFATAVNGLSGQLIIERALFDTDGNPTGFSPEPISSHPIDYTGLTAEKLNVLFEAPQFPGVYRVSYVDGKSQKALGSDELFVQE
jgi:pimeloyl-ACP methyl ester carboxylesterase